jgi:acylglycerol lipase
MNRVTAESTFECVTPDGIRLHVYRWLPDQPSDTTTTPRSLVVVVHGILEHAGRYAEMAGRLNRTGIAVWAFDLRGHGRSSGSRVWINHFDRYLDDVSLVLAEARAAHPGVPIFLFGHSMGGLIALQTRLAAAVRLAGLIVSAPALHVADEFVPWLRKLAAFGSRWFPWVRLARMGCSTMSRDPAVVADYRSDPLVHHGRIPTRTGAEIIRVGEETCQRAGDVKLPLLVLQGTADAVVQCQATEAFYQATGSGDKTLRLFPGLYHDLPREPEKAEICAEMANWILQRC